MKENFYSQCRPKWEAFNKAPGAKDDFSVFLAGFVTAKETNCIRTGCTAGQVWYGMSTKERDELVGGGWDIWFAAWEAASQLEI